MSAPVQLETRCGECLLYSAIQGMTDGLVLVDTEDRVFHLNRRAQEILGLVPRHVVGTRIDGHLRHPQMAALWAAAGDERSPVTCDLSFPSGASIQATISSCRSAGGRPIGRMIVLRDVSREKRIQVELAASVARRLVEMTGATQPSNDRLPLTPREREIVLLLVEGLSNARMAVRLHVSPNTIASHLKNIYSKLNVTGRAQTVALAVSRGMRPTVGDPQNGG